MTDKNKRGKKIVKKMWGIFPDDPIIIRSKGWPLAGMHCSIELYDDKKTAEDLGANPIPVLVSYVR